MIRFIDTMENIQSHRTLDFYNQNAKQYVAETADLDVSSVRHLFLDFIPKGGHILDLGCGSGRDSLYFIEQGYGVTAMDASSEMARLASQRLGQTVQVMSFQELNYSNTFDGIWACASLLHCPKQEMKAVTRKLIKALKTNGVLFMSFKQGTGERIDERGRFFNNYTELELAEILAEYSQLHVLDMFTESKPLRGGFQIWLNVFVRKVAEL